MSFLNIFSRRPVNMKVHTILFGNWKFVFYEDVRYLRQWYLQLGGMEFKAKRLKGFVKKSVKTVHVVKGDTFALGHEMEHVLDIIGDYE